MNIENLVKQVQYFYFRKAENLSEEFIEFEVEEGIIYCGLVTKVKEDYVDLDAHEVIQLLSFDSQGNPHPFPILNQAYFCKENLYPYEEAIPILEPQQVRTSDGQSFRLEEGQTIRLSAETTDELKRKVFAAKRQRKKELMLQQQVKIASLTRCLQVGSIKNQFSYRFSPQQWCPVFVNQNHVYDLITGKEYQYLYQSQNNFTDFLVGEQYVCVLSPYGYINTNQMVEKSNQFPNITVWEDAVEKRREQTLSFSTPKQKKIILFRPPNLREIKK